MDFLFLVAGQRLWRRRVLSQVDVREAESRKSELVRLRLARLSLYFPTDALRLLCADVVDTEGFWPPGGGLGFHEHLLEGGSRVDRDVIRRSLREQICSNGTDTSDSRRLRTRSRSRLFGRFYTCWFSRGPTDAKDQHRPGVISFEFGQFPASRKSRCHLNSQVAVPCPVDCPAHAY